MDIVFDCPNCSQELAVDSAGAGTQIDCPSCGETITIPQKSTKSVPIELPALGLAPSAITSSAAAKVQMHLKVPVRDTPGEILIARRKPASSAKPAGEKSIRIHTIRHAACVESGHDRFDEKVTEFLTATGEESIISVHTVSYEHFDVGTQKVMTDYGVLVIYRG